jgi:hypothetical protein
MSTRLLIFILFFLLLAGSMVVFYARRSEEPMQLSSETADHHSMVHAAPTARATPRIPAYQSAAQTLEPTLSPSKFVGQARLAYQVAREIPQTLAELPCYCECDKAFGHKSLHTCFVDTHASQCAVCIDEALLAYRLQKEEKLTPAQVRARIIEKYSRQ